MAKLRFSVIIPTRNRSDLFAVALSSVLEQDYRNYEVLVVDDGSCERHELKYRELVRAGQGMVRLLTLQRAEHGHGPGYGRNYGAAKARGDYLCFLDDDDQWTDRGHLERTAKVIAANNGPVNLIFANQQAFRNGSPVAGVIWIEDLIERLCGTPDPAGAYTVTVRELLGCSAHCHLNTTTVFRKFFLDIGGLDEALLYEEDRDFYLRAIDRAGMMKFLPWVVSRHNVPNPEFGLNSSTSLSELSKRLCQLRVFDKAVLFSERPEVRRYAMRQRAYTLKHIATEAAQNCRLDSAAYYAWQALIARPSLGWLATTTLFAMRRLVERI
jgi:glycosyltransferase involved in cell wall biosynthesis